MANDISNKTPSSFVILFDVSENKNKAIDIKDVTTDFMIELKWVIILIIMYLIMILIIVK